MLFLGSHEERATAANLRVLVGIFFGGAWRRAGKRRTPGERRRASSLLGKSWCQWESAGAVAGAVQEDAGRRVLTG